MPEKLDTTHVLMDNVLVLYQRERSTIWQCRYKVDGVWQRATTKMRDFKKANDAAKKLMITAEVRKESNLPVITRKFRHVAKLAIDRMTTETAAGKGKVSFSDYNRVINDYLIPFFGNHNITSINYTVLDEFNTWRTDKLKKAPSHSTLLTQNAALNRVFDEAVVRGFLTEVNRPKLDTKGKASERRPAFDLKEIHALFERMDAWVERARNDKSKELRLLLCDYIEVLLDTGARPGIELLNLKWNQITYAMKPLVTVTDEVYANDPANEEPEPVVKHELNRSCQITVNGKTGMRVIVGMNPTVQAFVRIIKRNYGVTNSVIDPFKDITIASNDDYVFRTKDKEEPTSFQKLFRSFLKEHSLLIDTKTGQERVFYSLRHTYATLALTHDKVAIHTLAVQMGTSVGMIERHYSHLDAVKATEQLRNYETRRLIAAGSVIEDTYKPKIKVSAKKKATAKN